MELKNKYIKCFTLEKAEELKINGYVFLYEKNGTFYFQNNSHLTTKFNNSNLLKNTKSSMWINI